MTFKPEISVMVSVIGKVDEFGKLRSSLHTFTFDSEEKLEEWLASAPTVKVDMSGPPDIHVEIPGQNRRRTK